MSMEQTKEGFWSDRVRAGQGEQLRVTVHVTDEREAASRFERLRTMSRALSAKGLSPAAVHLIRKAAERPDREGFDLAVQTGLSIAPVIVVPKARWVTFRDLGQSWTSGELHRLYPQHVKLKETADDDASRLTALYPSIGEVPLKSFSLDCAMRGMRNLPESARRPATHRQYAQVICKVLRYAEFPCQIAPYPLPPNFLPKVKKGEVLFPYLYPAEDLALCRSEVVPLRLRVLFGLINREGMRIGEALGMRWASLDKANGVFNVGTRKNGKPGTWPASPGSLEGLWLLRDVTTDGPFEGLPDDDGYAARLIDALRLAGVTRHELFASGEGRRKLRAHDLRSTFVTLSLATGKSEGWIMRRTGHSSSAQIHGYDRAAADWSELGLGSLARLDEALSLMPPVHPHGKIPGQGESQPVTEAPESPDTESPDTYNSLMITPSTEARGRTGKSSRSADFESAERRPEGSSLELSVRIPVTGNGQNGPCDSPQTGTVSQNLGPPASYLEALEAAARAAVAEHRWADVAALAPLIDAETRRAAPAAPVSLEAVRARREGK